VTAADDLTSVIAILAEACQEHDERERESRSATITRSVREAREVTAMLTPARERRMRPAADDLVRCMMAGDREKVRWFLAGHWTREDWRDLAVVLASDLAAREAQRAA
jgi:hypothetical protein